MKLHYLKSATIIVESKNVQILCDPWLIDGEYYGSWCHFPPYIFKDSDFENIDYIYISHIHPDHFNRETLKKLNSSIPVLIHKFTSPFLKKNIENLGFQVIELEHNKRTYLKNGVHINILAADDCNPEICGKFFGCGIYQSSDDKSSAQIDTLAVIDDGEYTIVNVNDCPIQLAESVAKKIKNNYNKIDFLLVGYTGAGPFPQCFRNLGDQRKSLGENKKLQFLNQGVAYINYLNPTYFMPFAGTYTLAGKLSELNDFRGVPELQEAVEFMKDKIGNSLPVLLNSKQYFDLSLKQSSGKYIPENKNEKKQYIENTLSKVRFSFENDPIPTLTELMELAESAYIRMAKVRKSIQFSSATNIFIPLTEGKSLKISMNDKGFSVVDQKDTDDEVNYVTMTVDPRLLYLILKGPKFAHWNNAEIGSHIEYVRKPEQFERGLYHCMSYFHA